MPRRYWGSGRGWRAPVREAADAGAAVEGRLALEAPDAAQRESAPVTRVPLLKWTDLPAAAPGPHVAGPLAAVWGFATTVRTSRMFDSGVLGAGASTPFHAPGAIAQGGSVATPIWVEASGPQSARVPLAASAFPVEASVGASPRWSGPGGWPAPAGDESDAAAEWEPERPPGDGGAPAWPEPAAPSEPASEPPSEPASEPASEPPSEPVYEPVYEPPSETGGEHPPEVPRRLEAPGGGDRPVHVGPMWARRVRPRPRLRTVVRASDESGAEAPDAGSRRVRHEPGGLIAVLLRLRFRKVQVAVPGRRYEGVLVRVRREAITLVDRQLRVLHIALHHLVWLKQG